MLDFQSRRSVFALFGACCRGSRLNVAQGAEGAWSIKKAKTEARRKRKVRRPCALPFRPCARGHCAPTPVDSHPAGVSSRREVQAGRRSSCWRWRREVKRARHACSFGVQQTVAAFQGAIKTGCEGDKQNLFKSRSQLTTRLRWAASRHWRCRRGLPDRCSRPRSRR